MRKLLKRIGQVFLAVLLAIVLFLTLSAIIHHISLWAESSYLVPRGKIVHVDGRGIHVFADGEKSSGKTLVFLSGSGTVAPVYDFKVLYNQLSENHRIVVVEKAGYGYSEISRTSRDIDSLLQEVREALRLAGEVAPYVLVPHSMSGLEALYWAQKYPDEVEAIIGLDMATPESYDHFDFAKMNRTMNLLRASAWFGLHRIPGVYSLNTDLLTKDEIEQQKMLAYRNALNVDVLFEGLAVQRNASMVKKGGILSGFPILLFTSNGKEIGDFWVPCQENFAAENNAYLVKLDCGHYMHHHEAEKMRREMSNFLDMLGK